jgi:DNA-damage-inducible protein D
VIRFAIDSFIAQGDYAVPTITERLEAIKKLTPKGIEYWKARELMPLLGYARWENFQNAIQRSITAFVVAEEKPENHFRETRTMVEIGSGAGKETADYFLSRAACYIIAMNGDTSKPEIAEAQKYFAIQARRMERLECLITDQRRVALRDRVRDRNSKLNKTAQQAGVRRFALFHGAGIREMYKMRLADLKARRGIGENEDWLDRQGIEELAANEFRVTQTDAKIKRENIHGEEPAISAHAQVGREVRQTIERLGNTMPEDLMIEPPIKEIEKRLGPALAVPSDSTS